MVNEYIPPQSSYKCMSVFLRPNVMIQDPSGNWVAGPSPGKTTCILPKGHDGPHMNIRGECSDGSKKIIPTKGIKYD